ncbi:MAG: hypothetical protein LBE16_03655 [Clostridiales Family XIII bacterium]|jgi:hypothetical protein|nr:hypothetical protein [Clostridiales Family XIII bacterium]
MIRPLAEINAEYRAEIAAASPPAQAVFAPGENDAAAGPISTFGAEAKAVAPPGRKLSRYTIPIALAVVAIILIFVAVVLILGDALPEGEASEGARQTQEGGESGADVSGADVETGEVPGAERYDSALESLENEIDSARESETGTDADAHGADIEAAPGRADVAALYALVVGAAQADAVIRDTAAVGDLPHRRDLIERIDAYFLADADGDAVSLPSAAAINSDAAFTSLTEEANALINAVNAGLAPPDRLSEVIDLRKRAYGIYPVRVLKKLLAVDYTDLGMYYAADARRVDAALDALVRAIEYRVAYLRDLRSESGDRRAQLRRIGGAYAEIAAIVGSDDARKRHAAYIAECFYEMAAR